MILSCSLRRSVLRPCLLDEVEATAQALWLKIVDDPKRRRGNHSRYRGALNEPVLHVKNSHIYHYQYIAASYSLYIEHRAIDSMFMVD